MRVGFVFDTVLLKKNDYYGMTLTYEFFKERYLDKIDILRVITRCDSMENYKGNTSGYKVTNGERVEVSPISMYKKIPDIILKRKSIRNEMADKLRDCDKVIIRMPSVLGIVACDYCRKNNIPYMIEMVACAWDGYVNHTNRMGKIIAPFMFLYTKSRIKKCNYVLYVTNEFLQKRYPTNGKSFGCSDVVLQDFNENVLAKKIKQSKKFNLNEFSMCTVANVGMRYKGHIYAFKAIKKLKENGAHVKYYLAGNGNQEFLKKTAKDLKIEDSIIFLGSLNHDEVFNLLDDIDIYIQPSLQEGLPRALVEAMSRGCFCIGSDVGGIPELLNSQYIFKRKKYNQLFNIIMNLTPEKIMIENKNNYNKALLFEKNRLGTKRNKIYNDFLEG